MRGYLTSLAAVLATVGSASAATYTQTLHLESNVVDPAGMSGKVGLFVDVNWYQENPAQRLIPRKDLSPSDVGKTFEVTPAGGMVPPTQARNGIADPVTIFFIQPDTGNSYGGFMELTDEPTFLFGDASGVAGIDFSSVPRYRVFERLDALTLTPISSDDGSPGYNALATYTLTIETLVPEPTTLAVAAPALLLLARRRGS